MPNRHSPFDPRVILAALERNYVNYVLIGGLAQVLRGADQITNGVDICPSFASHNLDLLARASEELDAERLDGRPVVFNDKALDSEPVMALSTSAGSLQVVGAPAGAEKGYVDLRRAASKEHLGHGVQPLVASASDLARMAAALHRDQDLARLAQLRRITELEADRQQAVARPASPTLQPSLTGPQRGRRLTR
jgi:hypothetical protein